MKNSLFPFLIDENVLTQDELAQLKARFSEIDRLTATQARYGHDQVRRQIKDAAKRASEDYSPESFEHYENVLSGQEESRERIAILRRTAKLAIKTFIEKEWVPFVSVIATRVHDICTARIQACSEAERQLALSLRVDYTPSSGVKALGQAAQEFSQGFQAFQVAGLGDSRELLQWLSERPTTAEIPPAEIPPTSTTATPPTSGAEIQGPSLQEQG